MNGTGYDIRDPALAGQGVQRIEWALQEMPVMRGLAARFSKTRPLQGVLGEFLNHAAIGV
jgi:adenosylhomocysteinase